MLLLTLPLLVLTACVIRLSSPDLLLRSKLYLGADSRAFRVWTLQCPLGAAGSSRSAALIKLGRIIYITRVDQLTLLFSLVRGDLTLVGPCPQPLIPSGTHRMTGSGAHLKPGQKPGLTGWYAAN